MATSSFVRVIAFALFVNFCRTSAFPQEMESEAEIRTRIFKNYSNEDRPPGLGPTIVTVNLFVRSLDNIDDLNQEYSAQVILRLEWKDDRLKFRRTNEMRKGFLSLSSTRNLWLPDIFIRNEKTGYLHDILMPNMFARVFPDGNILCSIRLSLKLACPMHLDKFPFDSQKCTIGMASYGMTSEEIIYQWKSEEPVQMSLDLNLTTFSLIKTETGTCESKTNTGIYSCLKLDFLFKRKLNHYLLQIYIPCTSLVILAWLSFWINSKEVIPRILITVPSYLIMFMTTYHLNSNLPKTSYTKAVDVWTGVCLTFVFVTIFETIAVYFLPEGIPTTTTTTDIVEIPFRKRPLAKRVDIISRILYPVVFVLFAGIYFSVYRSS